jgi:phage terminase small subunit
MTDQQAQGIAIDLMNGKSQADSLRNNGYKENTALYNSTETLKNNKIQHYLQKLKTSVSERMFSKIESIADLPETMKTKHGEKADPTVLKAAESLLDRAGYGKINKSMHVSKKVSEYKNIDEVKKRIAEVEAQLAEHTK